MCRFVIGNKVLYVVNLMGTVFIDNFDCPAKTMDRILNKINDSKMIVLDFHAEATAEKNAWFLSGWESVSYLWYAHSCAHC